MNGDGWFYHKSICQQFEIKFDPYTLDYFRDTCQPTGDCPPSWINRTDCLHYSSFDDVYEVQRNEKGTIQLDKNHRPVYHQRGDDRQEAFGPDSPPGKIFYCQEEKAWVFTIDGVNKGQVDREDGGCNWLMKSPESDVYSLHEVDTEGWIKVKGESAINILSCHI